jgi:transcriptional regulator with XRE-family HTH domain
MRSEDRDVTARIASTVRKVRTTRGWSQLALAERADLSLNYVSMIERAERLPSVEVLVDLARALGVELAALVGGPSEEADPWVAETVGLLRALPAEARPLVLGMLRGASDAAVKVRAAKGGGKRRRATK